MAGTETNEKQLVGPEGETQEITETAKNEPEKKTQPKASAPKKESEKEAQKEEEQMNQKESPTEDAAPKKEKAAPKKAEAPQKNRTEKKGTKDVKVFREKETARDILEKLDYKNIYKKPRVFRLSEKKINEMFPNEYIAGKGSYNAVGKSERNRYIATVKSIADDVMSNPKALVKAEVFGYEFDEQGDPVILAETEAYDDFVIRIPYSEFTRYNKDAFVGEEGMRHLSHIVKGYMGAKIETVVNFFDEESQTIYGSRIEAMAIRAAKNYVPSVPGGVAEIHANVPAGAIACCVTQSELTAEIFGAETVIKSEELSWFNLDALSREFRPGDTFVVKILSVKPETYSANGRTHQMFGVVASKRLHETNPNEKNFEKFHVGQRVVGTLKKHTGNDYFYNVRNMLNVHSGPAAKGRPLRGDKVVLKITDMDEKTFRVNARVID